MNNKDKEIAQKEIVDSLPLKPHGSLILSPRLGKTKIVLDIIKKNKPKSILWVTPLSDLADIEIPKEFETWKAKAYLKKLTTTTWASLSKLTGHFEVIILDEEQYATENNLSGLLNKTLTADYIISMTGTESRSQVKQDLYARLNLGLLYEYDLNEAVDANLLADYTINVVKIPMSKERNILAGSKEKPFLTTEEKQYEYLSSQVQKAIMSKRKDAMFRILARLRAIKNSPAKARISNYLFNTLEGRVLCFSPSIEAAEKLSHQTYHSKTDNTYLRQFIDEEIDKLSLVNAGGTGVTYKNINHLIVTQADKDDNGLTSQKITRTLLHQGEDYKAVIWILCLEGTQDEKWVESTLQRFNREKVNYISTETVSTWN